MKRLLIISWGLLLLAFLAANLGATIIMPLKEVKAGMKGKGRTVFAGQQVEEFDVTIIGVLENVEPKRNIILAELTGKGLDQTGVISGMSGSPVYIEDKLIGAVAYSFPYARKAIAGLTPIEEMLAAGKREKGFRSPAGLMASFKPDLSIQEILELNPGLFPELRSSLAGINLQRLAIPLVFSGFSPFLLEKNRHLLARLGFVPVASGGASSPELKVTQLKEGDPVALQLITGDLNLAAIGTVTYVEGNQILAFGHPLYNLGSVDYGLAPAEILTVVPSLETSFKLAKPGPTIGRFVQDRNAGAVGEIGPLPQTIPLNINLIQSTGDYKNFRLQLVNDRILTPVLFNLALYSIVLSESRAYGNLTVEFSSELYLDNGQNIHLEDLFSGNLDKAATSLANLVASVVYYLINNEFQEIRITRVDFRIRTTEEVRLGTLERVACSQYEVSPGEKINIKVFYRTFRDESVVEEVSLTAPHLPPGSEFQLIVGDAASMHQIELELYQRPEFSPRNLNQLIRLLNNLRKNNRIYFKLLVPRSGVFLRGEEMGSLPLTLRTMLTSPRSVTSAIALTNSTLAEYQLPISHAFKGLAKIPIRIKP